MHFHYEWKIIHNHATPIYFHSNEIKSSSWKLDSNSGSVIAPSVSLARGDIHEFQCRCRVVQSVPEEEAMENNLPPPLLQDITYWI